MLGEELRAPSQSQDGNRQFVTALARGLRILQCFTPQRPELTTAEIARMTSLPQPTVWRLCYTMLKLGYLAQSHETQKLRPGLTVLTLGHAALSTFPLTELARPAMQELADRFQGAVSLGARQGLQIIYLQRCQGSAIVFSDLQVGSCVPIADAVSGWAYLAAVSEQERKTLMRQCAEVMGDRWPRVVKRITDAIRQFSATGYVAQKGMMHPDINAVAVPLSVGGRADPLTLSAGGIASKFTDEVLHELGTALVGLARALSVATSNAGNRDSGAL